MRILIALLMVVLFLPAATARAQDNAGVNNNDGLMASMPNVLPRTLVVRTDRYGRVTVFHSMQSMGKKPGSFGNARWEGVQNRRPPRAHDLSANNSCWPFYFWWGASYYPSYYYGGCNYGYYPYYSYYNPYDSCHYSYYGYGGAYNPPGPIGGPGYGNPGYGGGYNPPGPIGGPGYGGGGYNPPGPVGGPGYGNPGYGGGYNPPGPVGGPGYGGGGAYPTPYH